jgi:hypothetical protein
MCESCRRQQLLFGIFGPSLGCPMLGIFDYLSAGEFDNPQVGDCNYLRVGDYNPSVGDYNPSVGDYLRMGDYNPSVGDYLRTGDYNPSVGDYPRAGEYNLRVGDYPRVGDYIGDANSPILGFNCVLFVQKCIHQGFTHCNICLSRHLYWKSAFAKFCCSSSILFA